MFTSHISRVLRTTGTLTLLGVFLVIIQAAVPPTDDIVVGQAAEIHQCETVLQHALNALATTCQTLGRNQACYGNPNVEAVMRASSLAFAANGDIVPISAVERLFTYPLDIVNGTWGLSVLKLQVNLPNSMPGQNVTFLVYGDTNIENVSGDMQVFTLSTGVGRIECNGLPENGLMVMSPQHQQIRFTVNGVEVHIASTVMLEAVPHEQMTLYLLDGHANVQAQGQSQQLVSGEYTTILMGGTTGLEAVDTPSEAQSISLTVPVQLMESIQELSAPPQPTVMTQGCVSAMDGNLITLGLETLLVPDSVLPDIHIGDCYQIQGTYRQEGDDGIILPISITNTSTPSSPSTGSSTSGMGMGDPAPPPNDGMGMGDPAPPPDDGMGMGMGDPAPPPDDGMGMGMGDPAPPPDDGMGMGMG